MSGFRNEGFSVAEYVYDFAVDGGATGVIELSAKAGKAGIPLYSVVKSVHAKVVTTCTSGGSATVALGNGTDDDGYIVAVAVATLVDNYCTSHSVSKGALLWDDTNDNDIPAHLALAADQKVSVKINTAALTAGKIVFWVEYYRPTLD